jgi:6-phosphogluconolactonase (cycloisomerase 2 family)
MLSAKESPLKKAITQAMACFAAVVFVTAAAMMATGAAMAQNGNTCVYANDDVFYNGNGPNTVDGYLVTATSHTYLSPVDTGGYGTGDPQARNIAINRAKNILYVSDSHSGDIAVMKINTANCLLTLLGDFPAARPNDFGIGLAISADGKWLYADAVKTQKLIVFGIKNNGSLTPGKQKLTLPSRPSSMAVSPDSATLIVGLTGVKQGLTAAFSYSINPATGKLTQVSTAIFYTRGFPSGFSIDSNGKFVYVSQDSDNNALQVAVFEIGAGSTLTLVHSYNIKKATDPSPIDTLLSADGKYLYVTNYAAATVVTLRVDNLTGDLKYVTTSSDGTVNDSFPAGLAESKDGSIVFTGNVFLQNAGILAANGSGSLTSLGTFPMGGHGFPIWIVAKTF